MSSHLSSPVPTANRNGLLARTRRFSGEVVDELAHVTWPTGRETVRYTAIVLTFLVVMVALIGLADTGLGLAVSKVFG